MEVSGELWTDARCYATVALPRAAGRLEGDLVYELRPFTDFKTGLQVESCRPCPSRRAASVVLADAVRLRADEHRAEARGAANQRRKVDEHRGHAAIVGDNRAARMSRTARFRERRDLPRSCRAVCGGRVYAVRALRQEWHETDPSRARACETIPLQ
jgi:hypothetical protein